MNRKYIKRRNAYLCQNSGMNQILIDLKPHCYQSELYINQELDVTNLVTYLNKLKETNKDITYFHAFTTLIGKVIYLRPYLNRFVSNRHLFEHDQIIISFVMKVSLDDKSEEIMVLIPIEKNDNIYTISKKIKEKVDTIRNKKNKKLGANKAIITLGKLPNIIRVPIIGIFKYLDKKGLLPKSLIKDNIYYSSMIVSNIGSLKCGGIYHNVTDFGTCSGLITIGEVKERVEIINNKEVKKYYAEFGMTIDERIVDGFYFIKSIHLLEYLLNNPSFLEGSIDEELQDL